MSEAIELMEELPRLKQKRLKAYRDVRKGNVTTEQLKEIVNNTRKREAEIKTRLEALHNTQTVAQR